MSQMSLEKVKKRIGNMINICPNCRFKNITYSVGCDSCGFSWQRYYEQIIKGDKSK